MKIAVIKLGARIMWETDAAVGPGEAISICKALTQGGAEVHVFTKILPKDTLHESIQWHNILDDRDTDGLDVLLIINGNVNFFGGAEDRAQILNYEIINQFKGTVAYVMCDPELPLLQIWPSVSGKAWGAAYEEQNLNVTRADIVLMSQPADLEKVKARWPKSGVQLGKIVHFPFERFPLLNEHLEPHENPPIDLMYGGTTRGGRRVPNIFKWYFGHPDPLKVEVFGKIDIGDFAKHSKVGARALNIRVPDFSGKVSYSEVLPKMNTSLAHLVTGDPSYEEINIIPQRTYECLAAGNLVFVDAKMDTDRRIYPDITLGEFMYVTTRAELSERIQLIKDEPMLRDTLIDEQWKNTAFDSDDFCTSLVEAVRAL